MDATKKITKNLGGDRLGSGNKMTISMHAYDRSTHDLSRAWRSSMNCGTLVPCFTEVALPGDTWSIDTEAIVRTVPTLGPLYGSFKMQIDFFQCPIRLYNGLLHNNMTKIGMNMEQVKLPKMVLATKRLNRRIYTQDYNVSQIASDSLLNYLGLSGIGESNDQTPFTQISRKFNAVPVLAYWDIYKNYYANKQEEKGYYIGTTYQKTSNSAVNLNCIENLSRRRKIKFKNNADSTLPTGVTTIGTEYQELATPIQMDQVGWDFWEGQSTSNYTNIRTNGENFDVTDMELILEGTPGTYIAVAATTALDGLQTETAKDSIGMGTAWNSYKNYQLIGISYVQQTTAYDRTTIKDFPLQNIDDARIAILQNTGLNNELTINTLNEPYNAITGQQNNGIANSYLKQFGLAIKTYQSDILNNWLKTEWIEGPSGINTITAIDTSSGNFTIDALNLANRVYNMLNRIAVSGGSYEDWVEAVYSTEAMRRAETPIYIGGMSTEVVFQEVVSQTANEEAALGQMAGRGTTTNAKGGHIEVRVEEPSYIIGIVSLTPRIDYSQGNKWDITELDTLADLHKPALDGIGFEDLLQERAAWFGTYYDINDGEWKKLAMGKTPAWINYMTAKNETHGTFAEQDNCMYMTLNRNYKKSNNMLAGLNGIADTTTYIDPRKYNYAFADTSLDAQNFWVQIGMRVETRRVMSAKIMPNL